MHAFPVTIPSCILFYFAYCVLSPPPIFLVSCRCRNLFHLSSPSCVPLPSFPSAPAHTAPTALPEFDPIRDLYPNNAPPTKALNHAAFLGTSGGGKTVALVHCAMVLANYMGWWSGHVCAIMPRDTYDGNPLHQQMLRPEQVYFVEDYDAAGLIALMRYLLGYAG